MRPVTLYNKFRFSDEFSPYLSDSFGFVDGIATAINAGLILAAALILTKGMQCG